MNLGHHIPGLVSFPALGTPLGQLNFGGVLRNGTGTGFDGFRIYGMYAVSLILKGRGKYADASGYQCTVRPGDLIVVFPELAHQYGPPEGETWDEIFVAFEGAAFDAWRAEGLEPARPVWHVDKTAYWFKRIERILKSKPRTRSDACTVSADLHRLISEWLALREPDAEPRWLDAARHSLSDPSMGRDLAPIARAAGLSLDAFRRAFRAATGEPPARFQRRQRLVTGANLLHRRELTLKQIADALGFHDEFHFSKAFKAQYGVSPKTFRANTRKSGLEKFSPRLSD
jgi:AraC-like DNA-binding protein